MHIVEMLMQNPLISVMIPVYNREKYIKQAIDSVLAQDYRPIEIIVVDDGSTDNTAEIIKQYNADIVKYFYKDNIGMDDASARNLCVAKSSGEYLAWLDSDDYYLPGKLTAQMCYMQEHPECEIVFTQVEDFFDNDETKKTMRPEVYMKITFGGTSLFHATMLAKRSMFLRTGPRNETLRAYEDQEWLYRLHFKYGVDLSHCLKDVYYNRRLHENGLAYSTRSTEVLNAVTKITNTYMRDTIRRRIKETIHTNK